jgi:hypothetical protein
MSTRDIFVPEEYVSQWSRESLGMTGGTESHKQSGLLQSLGMFCVADDIGYAVKNSGLVVVEHQCVGKAEHWRCYVGEQIRHRCVDLAWLPDVILIAKKIDVGLDTLEELEKRTGITLMLRLMPFADIDTRPQCRGANGFSGGVSRMVIDPVQCERGYILLE